MNETPIYTPVRYRWRLLNGGDFWLDAGTMFGLIPKVVWGKLVETDDANRIAMTTNCLLLEPAPGSVGATGPVLIEAGSGDKFDAKSRAIYRMDGRGIVDSLTEIGVTPELISLVLMTHLHFDHVGGMTRLAKPGEPPDWTDPNTGLAIKRVFPNARMKVDHREWLDAINGRSVMTRTYLPENLLPLREMIDVVDVPSPFAAGATLERDAMPEMPWRSRMVEPAPGIFMLKIPGHTAGQCAIGFTDEAENTVVYCPDLMPMIHHVGAAYNLAYDAEPYFSMINRRWFLTAATEENWLLVLTHEPKTPLVRVRRNDKGWFMLIPEQ